MWELQVSTSHKGVLSVRSILTYVFATIIAALLFIIAMPQLAHAADASWNGAAIVYDNNQYTGPAAEQTVTALGLPQGTIVYTFVEPSTASNRKMHIIYFAPGSDPGTASTASYRTHSYGGPNTLTNPSTAVAVSLDPQTANVGTTSCAVDGGLGWLICPITNTLATWMDWVFDVLASFLEVRPIQTGQDNALYRAWSYMRTFANIAFVIAFLVIIYSQLTSYGVSNYGIKKLLPRIIIAAVLVNVSYIICSLAIDLSNLLGFSIQNMFIGMRNTLVGVEGNSWDVLSWESVSTFILSGGAMAAGASIGLLSAVATYGSMTAAALAILLPALVILIVAVLVALLVMASRQALITILTILAPLAFVAFLLPNTEKWFDKWRSIFMTMLILFPAFSVIFGGSQLAGTVIIQNADSINLILLGMIVQVAPLFVTPLLIKFSGSLLGRIAGIVNNPNKGIIDRTRNFAKDRAENMKAKTLSTPAKRWELDKKAAQRFDHNRRRREGWRNARNAMADGNWANSQSFRDVDQMSREADDRKALGETVSNQVYNEAKLKNVTIQRLDVEVRNAKAVLDNLDKGAELQYKNLQSKADAMNVIPSHLAASALTARLANRDSRITASAINAAEDVRNLEYAKDMETSAALRQLAGGIDPHGASHALAAATQTIHKAFDTTVAAERTTMTGLDGTRLASIYTDTSLSTERRAAAVSQLINVGGDDMLHDALDYLGTAKHRPGTSLQEKEALSDLMKQFGADLGPRKPISLGNADLAALKVGEYDGTFDSKVVGRLTSAGGKLSVDSLRNASADELKRILTQRSSVSAELKQAIRDFKDPSKNPNIANQMPAKEISDLMDQIAR